MPAEQSSLEQAMNRIMGAPAGGTPQSAGTAQQANDVVLAPRTPYSQELETATPATSLSIGNTPFDPYAAEAVQLAAMQAQTAALQSQIAGTGTTGTAAPAAAAAAAAAPKPVYSSSYTYGTTQPGTFKVGSQGDLSKMIDVTPQNINDPWVRASLEDALLRNKTQPSTFSSLAIPAYENILSNKPSWGSAGGLKKPVNPGPRAPWQASAQYWKDLEAYKKAGGV
jgi:hypothetical protein